MSFRTLRYVRNYVLAAFAIPVLSLQLFMISGFQLPVLPFIFLPALIAASLEGFKIGLRARAPLPDTEIWRMTRQLSLLALILNLGLGFVSCIWIDTPLRNLAIGFIMIQIGVFLAHRVAIEVGFHASFASKTQGRLDGALGTFARLYGRWL